MAIVGEVDALVERLPRALASDVFDPVLGIPYGRGGTPLDGIESYGRGSLRYFDDDSHPLRLKAPLLLGVVIIDVAASGTVRSLPAVLVGTEARAGEPCTLYALVSNAPISTMEAEEFGSWSDPDEYERLLMGEDAAQQRRLARPLQSAIMARAGERERGRPLPGPGPEAVGGEARESTRPFLASRGVAPFLCMRAARSAEEQRACDDAFGRALTDGRCRDTFIMEAVSPQLVAVRDTGALRTFASKAAASRRGGSPLVLTTLFGTQWVDQWLTQPSGASNYLLDRRATSSERFKDVRSAYASRLTGIAATVDLAALLLLYVDAEDAFGGAPGGEGRAAGYPNQQVQAVAQLMTSAHSEIGVEEAPSSLLMLSSSDDDDDDGDGDGVPSNKTLPNKRRRHQAPRVESCLPPPPSYRVAHMPSLALSASLPRPNRSACCTEEGERRVSAVLDAMVGSVHQAYSAKGAAPPLSAETQPDEGTLEKFEQRVVELVGDTILGRGGAAGAPVTMAAVLFLRFVADASGESGPAGLSIEQGRWTGFVARKAEPSQTRVDGATNSATKCINVSVDEAIGLQRRRDVCTMGAIRHHSVSDGPSLFPKTEWIHLPAMPRQLPGETLEHVAGPAYRLVHAPVATPTST